MTTLAADLPWYARRRVPLAVLALLWNAVGALDFTMTQTRNASYLADFPPEMMAYIDSLPGWVHAAWGVGTWGGLAGAVLMLIGLRAAVWPYAASLVASALVFVQNHLLTQPPAGLGGTGAMLFSLLIVVLAGVQWVWARRGASAGWLR
ncbi:hypothetical protein KAK06_02885 [Ideonella sp. 4Y11]|uniref:DoxX family protein n=1 Tax=Ideonella aquatica TaxID=2824119 RepID=A0A940YR34_9BURK|nr:hypothetical protein [Ideonella aquatica]MBQ0957895.1 hypothetical protein [Ideonella aquatica]